MFERDPILTADDTGDDETRYRAYGVSASERLLTVPLPSGRTR